MGEEVYWWVDENGVKRFSDQPPPATTDPDTFGRTEAIPYNPAEDRKRTEADRQRLKAWADDQMSRQEAAEADARRLRERKEAEQARIEAERQQAEAIRKAEMEAKRSEKSAAKKARTRPPAASPK